MDSNTRPSQTRKKGVLLVGFVSLAIAVLVAHESPAEAYELSIYAATPLTFWVATGVALLITIFVGLYAEGVTRRLALVLGGMTMLAVSSLPVLRSYYYYGAGDSLTHLGWAKDIAAGQMPVVSLLYPATHTIGVFLTDLTGMGIHRALLVTVMALNAVFLLFVPLATWTFTHDRRATTFAAFSGFLFLPVNNVAVFAMPYPTMQAITFFPLVLYLLARYLTRADRENLAVGTETGALMVLASVAMVLFHPQQAVNVILVFGGVLGLQLFVRRFRNRQLAHRNLAFQTVALVAVFLLWTSQHETAGSSVEYLVTTLLTGVNPAQKVTHQAVALSDIGGSIVLLFLKLFLVSVVFSALTGLVILGSLRDRLTDPNTSVFARYFGLGLVALCGLFLAYLLTSYGKYHFRQLGFVMVLVTILGAIGLRQASGALRTRISSVDARTVVGVVFVVLLSLSGATIYNSPYIYQGSRHVTEAQQAGFETAFEHRGDHKFIGIRSSGSRWIDAAYGVDEQRRQMAVGSLYTNERHPATGENFTGSYVAAHYDGRYLIFTDRLRQQELRVYDGLRFGRTGFRSLNATPGLNRVQANGDVQMYLINKTS